jgi:hypothetical protein
MIWNPSIRNAVHRDSLGPAITGSDPIRVWEGDPEHRCSPASTLGLIDSGSRLRASPRVRSMTTRSPSGERRPPTSKCTTVPLLRSVGMPATSHSRSLIFTSGGEREEEKRMVLGFVGERFLHWFCSHYERAWPSITDLRLVAFWAESGLGGWRVSWPQPSLCYEILARARPDYHRCFRSKSNTFFVKVYVFLFTEKIE